MDLYQSTHEDRIPHRIAKSKLLHILQVLLTEFTGTFLIRLAILLPLASGLRVALRTSDLLEYCERRGD